MKAVGVPSDHPSIQKAIGWLLSKKNADGGWGESCKSDIFGEYIPLSYSTLVHSSWALDTLILVFDSDIDEINNGILNIINWMRIPDNRITYPTGGGLPGHFYIYYHSYQYIWPLLTLSHYQNKFK
jgi:sporulenol synthase